MPKRIERDVAVTRAVAERPEGSCLVCAILAGEAGPTWVVHEGEHVRVVLSRYPRNWGQAMVLLRRHVTSFSALDPMEWAEATEAARRTAVQMEKVLDPVRCFVSCLGTAHSDLPMSSPHMHLHVDPVYDADQRPRTTFTLEFGVMEGEPHEWEELRAALAW